MKKFILPVLLFVFIFASMSLPREAAAKQKVYCSDLNDNGIWGDVPGEILTYHWWQKKPVCASSSAVFGRIALPIVSFKENVLDFNESLNTLASGINPTGFSNLTRNTPNSTNVNNAVNFLYGLGFFPSVPTQSDPFGPTAVNSTTAFQNAFKITPTGTFGSNEATTLKNFSSSFNSAVIAPTLPANLKTFMVWFPGDKSVSVFNSDTGVFRHISIPTQTQITALSNATNIPVAELSRGISNVSTEKENACAGIIELLSDLISAGVSTGDPTFQYYYGVYNATCRGNASL